MNMASLIQVKPNPNLPSLNPGDTVKVSIKIVEGDKERTQVFQGVVIKVKQGGAGPILTVRRVTYGVGVERTFPLSSPRVEKVEIVRHGKTRRARLYYLRGLSARASRIKEKRVQEKAEEPVEEKVEEKIEAEPKSE
jgi:large subunit ribosomal protein L19